MKAKLKQKKQMILQLRILAEHCKFFLSKPLRVLIILIIRNFRKFTLVYLQLVARCINNIYSLVDGNLRSDAFR